MKNPVARQNETQSLPRERLQLLRAPTALEPTAHLAIVPLDRLKRLTQRSLSGLCRRERPPCRSEAERRIEQQRGQHDANQGLTRVRARTAAAATSIPNLS